MFANLKINLILCAILAFTPIIASACFLFSDPSCGGGNVSGNWRIDPSYTRSGDTVTVNFRLTNVGQENHNTPSGFFGDNYFIIDDQGREFEPSNFSDGTFIDGINPGLSTQGQAIFPVPSNATGLVFQFDGGESPDPICFNLN